MIEYGTDLAIELPSGYCALLMPRSSIGKNTTLALANSCGLLDSDYRGEIKFQFRELADAHGLKYKIGDRIGQILIIKNEDIEFQEVNELSNSERGTGGFGSSGR